ncbi:syntaxin-1A-like [Sphaeramia orbicularis]|uniref:syntaxin-1A-like n=1 Tax=Sphaeramia orbicularis TaxID=375764 RepID=UPI00118131C1|nr:syntaxin-1A-like [Sphaeramia orbicularis]
MTDNTKRADMEEFFKTVGEVRVLIETISNQVEEVERRHGVILSNPNKDHRNKEELQKLNSDINRNSNLVRARLKSIQKNLLLEENGKSASVIQRIHKNQHSHLTLCFVDVMRSYYRAQIDFREKCKARIQRQLEIVDKITTDEELEDMLNGDNPEIFISDIKSEARLSSQALNGD